MLSIC